MTERFRTGVQFSSSPPRHGEPFGSPYFIFKIRLHFIGCRSFFEKSHARLNCSVVNALSTFRCRYQLFSINHKTVKSSRLYTSEQSAFDFVFAVWRKHPSTPLLFLLPKKPTAFRGSRKFYWRKFGYQSTCSTNDYHESVKLRKVALKQCLIAIVRLFFIVFSREKW